jgi:hypothetical protein
MSAKVLPGCSFEPAAERTAAARPPTAEGLAAESQFREGLWREYRREAINAGCNAAQAAEYASALSPEVGVVAGVLTMAPVGCGWFYESQSRVVMRTITSGLIALKRWEKSKTNGRMIASNFQPWMAGWKN